MKIMYTCGKAKEPIYLEDSQYELLKEKKMYVSNGNVICKDKGKTKSIASLLYPDLRRAIRIDVNIHDYRPSNIKKESGESSVYKVKVKDCDYFVGKIYIDGTHIVVPGYYKTKQEALLVREAYILHRGMSNVARNDIGLSEKEILKEYAKVLKQKESKMKKTIAERAKKQHVNAIKNRASYGLYKSNVKGKDFYKVYVNNIEIGNSRDITVAKCIRNVYLVDNNIKGDKVYDVGMNIDEQRKFIRDYKSQAKLTILNGKTYRGVSNYTRGKTEYYAVQVLCNGKRKFIGSSRDQKMTAMMYNVHKFKIGQITKPINDVGLTVEEQVEVLEKNGYYMTDDFRFKKRKGNK